MQTLIIVLGLILVISVLLFYYFQGRHYQSIDSLNALKVDLYNDSIDDLFDQAYEVKFTGASEQEFSLVEKQWQTIQHSNYPRVANLINQAEKASDIFRFIQASQLEKEAEDLIALTNQDLMSIKQNLHRFLEAAENNQQAMSKMMEKYKKMRRDILTQSYRFGPTLAALDQNLKEIEVEFDQFSIYTSKGDHVEAKTNLEKAKEKIDALTQRMTIIPAYLENIKKTYPQELTELRQAYRRFKSKNIAFKNDTILEDISIVEKQADQMYHYLADLHLGEAKQEKMRIEERIDQLYDLMENEYQSQQRVKKQFDQLLDIIDRLYERNRQIKIETDRLSQDYYLGDKLLSYGARNNQEIAESEYAFNRLRSDIEQNDVVYSTLSKTVDIVFNKTQQLYEQQQEFLDYLYGLEDEEKLIKARLDDFAHAMSQMTQRLDRSNLPGAKDEFYDLYYYTTNRIHDLDHELGQIRLNMEEVHYLYQIIKEDIEQLQNECEDMLNYAQACEQIIQHLNKYRSQYPQMESQMELISHYYYTEFNYQQAFELAAETLNKVAPHEMAEIKNQIKRQIKQQD